MPLVTRQVNQGVFFRTDTEPPDWLPGDIWIDTDNSQVFTNLAGTALQFGAGTLNQGDVLFSDSDESLAPLAKGTALQVLTMNSGATLPEWAEPAGGSWELLFNHIATSAEASFTFTPSSALTNANFTEFVVIVSGFPTASFQMQCEINGLSDAKFTTLGGVMSGSAISFSNLANQTEVQFGPANAGEYYYRFQFGFLQAHATFDGLGGTIDGNAGFQRFATMFGTNNTVGADITEITSIKLQTSTSTWKIGSTIEIYGIVRT